MSRDGLGRGPVDKPLSELIADARRLALQARKNTLRAADDRQKRDWAKIAAMWDQLADAYERLVARGAR